MLISYIENKYRSQGPEVFLALIVVVGLPWWLRWYRIHLPMQETWVRSLGQEDALEKEVATHSSILPWEILQTGERVGYSPRGHKRARHDSATKQQQRCNSFAQEQCS